MFVKENPDRQKKNIYIYIYIKRKLLADFQICISVSLRTKPRSNCYHSIGAGTAHRVNGIVVQSGKFTETIYSNYEQKKEKI